MKTNLRVAWEELSSDRHEKRRPAAEAAWMPSPKLSPSASWARAEDTKAPSVPAHEAQHKSAGSENRVVSLNESKGGKAEEEHSFASCAGARFGFAGPTDCVTSLNIPADGANGQKHPSIRFEIEFDPDQPDRIMVGLLDLDEDGFVRTVQTSIPFPARFLAELLSRRKATAEEIAEWRTLDGEE